jgi:hypothetical protein
MQNEIKDEFTKLVSLIADSSVKIESLQIQLNALINLVLEINKHNEIEIPNYAIDNFKKSLDDLKNKSIINSTVSREFPDVASEYLSQTDGFADELLRKLLDD